MWEHLTAAVVSGREYVRAYSTLIYARLRSRLRSLAHFEIAFSLTVLSIIGLSKASSLPPPRDSPMPGLLVSIRRSLLVLALTPCATLRAQQAAPIDWNTLRDETVQVLADYLRINTTNPPGDEAACIAYIFQFFADNSCRR